MQRSSATPLEGGPTLGTIASCIHDRSLASGTDVDSDLIAAADTTLQSDRLREKRMSPHSPRSLSFATIEPHSRRHFLHGV